MRTRLVALAALLLFFAGCTQPSTPEVSVPDAPSVAGPIVKLVPSNALTFKQNVVTAAVGTANDLYEPTMEASDDGTLYVAAHVAVAVTTGTPAYVSRDDGATWTQLPFADSVAGPGPAQGSAPPQGDEGYIVAGTNGQAWMVDVKLSGYPVTGWCNDGATQCYHNPDAYNHVSAATQPCSAESLNDRPWAAYSNGTLLMANNPGTGNVQIGVLQVPPALPVGVSDLPGGVMAPTWNMCAGHSSFIPGIPALRADGRFAVPYIEDDVLKVSTGSTTDLFKVNITPVIDSGHRSAKFGGGGNYGWAAFDGQGTLFVAAMNNTDDRQGQLVVGASNDAGDVFASQRFQIGPGIGFLSLDASANRTGALLTWAQTDATDGNADFYAAHVRLVGGQVVLEDVSLVAKDVVQPCGDVMNGAAGPDGRAYLVIFSSTASCNDEPLSTPLSVWVQAKGTPVLAPAHGA